MSAYGNGNSTRNGRGTGFWERLLHRLFSIEDPDAEDRKSPSRYRRMWRNTVIAVAAVSLVPLVVMTATNYYLFQRTFRDEIRHPLHRLTSVTKRSLESFLEERQAVLRYVVETDSFEDLCRGEFLAGIFQKMRATFGGFVDIGVIDAKGLQRSYAGPYNLTGKNYQDQDWFTEVYSQGVYVSDVFLGYRKLPHFVIAVKKEMGQGGFFIFRATIDTEAFERQILSVGLKQSSDVFILNKDSVLQTSSRLFGKVLDRAPFTTPPYTEDTEILEDYRIKGDSYLMGYARIRQSPFFLVVLAKSEDLMRGWLASRMEFLGFLSFSMFVVLILIMRIASTWVRRIRGSDMRREAALHSIEHTNKMASIGRLASGVAHEINNPLAIINEKAGLIHDLVESGTGANQPEKLLKQVDSILNSVKRCSDITHRLLGFAKHMDVHIEPIALHVLIKEVLAFLEKEALLRNIVIEMAVDENLPTVESDRGQLQQLFLNIINNAFDAMADNGRLSISIRRSDEGRMAVTITDNGIGMAREDLEHIFEPFFTKKRHGTGLGLSISYGIVQKLGGRMQVESEPGKGTSFTVVLPIKQI